MVRFSWSLMIFLFGLSLFFYGFFLSRKELGISSKVPWNHPIKSDKRVFLFIIDALRYDFVVPIPTKTCSSSSPYNCFSTIHQLLLEQPEHSAIFRFIADAPTVTAQRLKGLTVGCLPTFIDIGSNIDSAAISDDNILAQLRSMLNNHMNDSKLNNMTDQIVALGDDTWQSLYPNNIFDKLFMFDSFNTWDLDTVDNGILSHLWNFLPDRMEHQDVQQETSSTWKLLVTHFLGVDHIGHSFHAEHPLMSQRLNLMDKILHKIVDRLPEDAVLFLFGDHGMTIDGEHGGASQDETDSALFVYSKQPFREVNLENSNRYKQWKDLQGESEYNFLNSTYGPRSIPQIDLVPTLAYLLNLPIPFSSLGKFIPELMFSSTDRGDSIQLLDILRQNTLQIVHFFLQYHNIDTSFLSNGKEILSKLEEAFILVSKHRIFPLPTTELLSSLIFLDKELTADLTFSLADPSDEKLSELLQKYYQFLEKVQDTARQEWAEFKILPIIFGLVLMTGSVIFLVTSSCSAFTSFSLKLFQIEDSVNFLIYGVVTVVVLGGSIFQLFFGFSNSFVVEEKQLCFVLLQTWIIIANILYSLELEECFMKSVPRLISTLASVIASRLIWGLSQNVEDISGMFLTKLACACSLLYLKRQLMGRKYMSRCNNYYTEYSNSSFYFLQFGVFLFHFVSANGGGTQTSYDKNNFTKFLPQLILIGCGSIIIVALFKSRTIVPDLFNAFLTLYTLYMLTWKQQLLILTVVEGMKYEIYNLFFFFFELKRRSSYEIKQRSWGLSLVYLVIVFLLFAFVRLLFFLTGHACQFDRLQLQVAFVGQERFTATYGAWALGINTLGQEILLPLLFRKVAAENDIRCADNQLNYSIVQGYALLKMAILLFTCIASFHLRRHLMLWAIFAPKLVFEIALSTAGLAITWLTCFFKY